MDTERRQTVNQFLKHIHTDWQRNPGTFLPVKFLMPLPIEYMRGIDHFGAICSTFDALRTMPAEQFNNRLYRHTALLRDIPDIPSFEKITDTEAKTTTHPDDLTNEEIDLIGAIRRVEDEVTVTAGFSAGENFRRNPQGYFPTLLMEGYAKIIGYSTTDYRTRTEYEALESLREIAFFAYPHSTFGKEAQAIILGRVIADGSQAQPEIPPVASVMDVPEMIMKRGAAVNSRRLAEFHAAGWDAQNFYPMFLLDASEEQAAKKH